MATITWSDNLSVNIKEIDTEHKKLINMINELHSAMGSGKGREAMERSLPGLVDYTKTHFAYEEKLFQQQHALSRLSGSQGPARRPDQAGRRGHESSSPARPW